MPLNRNRLVVTDVSIMDGAAVFAGTRVPIDTVLASLDAGIEFGRLVASWPFLTEDHVAAARAYRRAEPSVPVRRRVRDADPRLRVVNSKVIRHQR